MVPGSNAAAQCALAPSLLSDLPRYVGIAWAGKLALRPLGCGIPLQLEISQTEPTSRTQSSERSLTLPEKSPGLRRQDPGTSLKQVTVYGVRSDGAKLSWARRGPVCSLLGSPQAMEPAGDAAEGKPLDVGHSPCSSPEFSSGCTRGAESSWFKTGNVKIWPSRALCPVESPQLQALRYHLNYYLLNIFP